MLTQYQMQFRVRYHETDGQGRLHHAQYANYFETARVELLRASGRCYRQIEEEGLMLVVAELSCRYRTPAQYDDLLTVTVRTVRAKGARIEHAYEVLRGEECLAEGRTVVACVDRSGKVCRLPHYLQTE